MLKKSMYALVTGLIFCLAFSAHADPRINVVQNNGESGGNFCHAILNTINDDDERFISGCDGDVIVNDTDGVAIGFAHVVRNNIPLEVVKFIIRSAGLPIDPEARIERKLLSVAAADKKKPVVIPLANITSEDFPGQECNLVESNAKQYQSNDWDSRLKFVIAPGARTGKLVFRLICRNAAVAQ